jgi:hypothetical protein
MVAGLGITLSERDIDQIEAAYKFDRYGKVVGALGKLYHNVACSNFAIGP